MSDRARAGISPYSGTSGDVPIICLKVERYSLPFAVEAARESLWLQMSDFVP